MRGQGTDHREVCRTTIIFFKNCNRGTLIKALTLEFTSHQNAHEFILQIVFLHAILKCSGKYKNISVRIIYRHTNH